MRLINTRTLRLEEFFGPDFPEYDILSHTWNEDEVTYQDYKAVFPRGMSTDFGSIAPSDLQKTLASANGSVAGDGMIKILTFCHMAHAKGVTWVWVDTCCINKESSAELSEAINSMYRWYRQSRVCWVYLVDAPSLDYSGDSVGAFAGVDYMNSLHARWMKARWFSRGFTLQELLAPRKVDFYDQKWKLIGNRLSLHKYISLATGIQSEILIAEDPTRVLHRYSIAQRMAWAAHRETRRVEDMAYSLLGIFGIHMSMLYGEGEHAFIRLQKKILKTTNDETIFAWNPTMFLDSGDFQGVLAPHPRAFLHATDIVPLNMTSEPASITSLGVGFPIYNHPHLSRYTLRIVLPLNCQKKHEIVGIELAKHAGTWYRVSDPTRFTHGLQSIGRNTTVPVAIFHDIIRESLHVSIGPTPEPLDDHGIGLNRSLGINGDLDEDDIDLEHVKMDGDNTGGAGGGGDNADGSGPMYVAVRFRTHLVPWPALQRSIDPKIAVRMQTSHPEITQIRSRQDLPVEMTDTGKEVVVHFSSQPTFVRQVTSQDIHNFMVELE